MVLKYQSAQYRLGPLGKLMDSAVEGDCGFSSHYLSDDFITEVLEWLRNLTLRDVCQQEMTSSQTISKAVDEILQNATRQTYQQAKALKQRAQVEAIASQCLRHMHSCDPECDVVLELGAGQAVLGHAVSLASNLPLVAVDRRSNTDALASTSTLRVQAEIAAFTTSLLPDGNHASSIGGSRAAIVVKHLCGHGFDEALALALVLHKDSRFGFFCGAPCCHATMRWASLSSEVCRWLREQGMPGTPDEAKAFSLLTDIIRLARVGADSKACGRWRLRHHVDDTEAALLGRKVCRLIDEGRLVHLESQGLTVRLLEYCHPSLSPDNILVLAKPKDLVNGTELPLSWPGPGAGSLTPLLPPSCILIELDPTTPHSLTARVAALLMEIKASGSLPIAVAGVADTTHVLTCSVLSTDSLALTELLQCLGHSLLLQRVVSRYMPLTSTATQVSDVVKDAQSGLKVGSPKTAQSTLRVSARPRSVEPDLCKALPSQMLDPVNFTHVLTVYHSVDFRYSLLPRSCFDPSAWSNAKREAHKESKVAFRFVEAGLRCRRLWKSDAASVTAVTGVVIWSDTKEAKSDDEWIRFASKVWGSDTVLAELRPACSSGWAARVETYSDVSLVPCRGTWYPLEDGRQDGASGNLLLLDASSTNEEAILLVRRILQTVLRAPSPALDRCGTAVLRLRCGRRPRAVKQWLKDMTHLIEETSSKFNRVELLHLLSDRENERTAIFSWSGVPTETCCRTASALEKSSCVLKAHFGTGSK